MLFTSAILLGSTYAGTLTITANATRSVIDTGQNSLITTVITGGTGSYTCAWSYYPLTNPSKVTSLSTTACSIIFQGNSSDLASPDIITLNANDSAGDTGSLLMSIAVKPGISSFKLTGSSNTIYTGNTVTFTNATSGGIAPFSYKYINIPASVTQSGNSFLFTKPGIYNITEVVSDSNNENASSSVSITVLPVVQPITVQISPQTAEADVGQSVQVSAAAAGGTGNYTYGWFVNGVLNLSSPSNTFAFSPSASGIYKIYAEASDNSGDTSDSFNSTITVNQAPTVTLSQSGSPTDIGQSITLTANEVGGTGAITYHWGGSLTGSCLSTSNICIVSSPTPGIFNISVAVTDSAPTPVTSGLASVSVTVNPILAISVAPASNSIYVGQNIILTNTTTGGTGPYVYSYTVPSNVIQSGNSFTFNSVGTFTITESVTDSKGEEANASSVIQVTQVIPSLSAAIVPSNYTIHKKQEVTLHAVLNTSAPTDSFVYQWYVKAPKSSAFELITNATGKNYTFDTFPQTTKGTYYLLVHVGDTTASISANSTLASVTVITPASCSNPHYNDSNCDNDNQKSCKNGDYQGYGNNGNWNYGSTKNQTWDDWNGITSGEGNYVKPCNNAELGGDYGNSYNYDHGKTYNLTNKPCNNTKSGDGYGNGYNFSHGKTYNFNTKSSKNTELNKSETYYSVANYAVFGNEANNKSSNKPEFVNSKNNHS